MAGRPEGCGVVPVASNQRDMDSRIYSPAQCVGQLAENAAAKGPNFNATEFNVTILTQFEAHTRIKGRNNRNCAHSPCKALKVLDNGVGFLYEEVEDMLTYGTPDKVTTEKKFGRNNHGLKAVAATLSPACCLLFSKSKDSKGVVWNTLAAIGSNFDLDGFYNLRRLSWPSDFKGTTLDELAAQQFYGRGSREAFHDLFSCSDGVASDGNEWASLKSLNIAHKHFREIKETGMLGIFPFHLQDSVVQADVSNDDIKMQGVSLTELLSKYFLHRSSRLLPEAYWRDFRGFDIKLHLSPRKVKDLRPAMPSFAMSPPIAVTIGAAEHTVVYGPYQTEKHPGPFPYKHTAGSDFYKQNYQTFLATRSRVMNPLYPPKTSDSGGTRTDYMSKNRGTSQKHAGPLMSQLLDTMCGVDLDHAEPPEAYAELRELLDKHQIFNMKNPYLHIDEYVKQLKNLKWLLGLPFEVYARVDTSSMEFNDAKDDLKDDALKRDSFFANVHAAIALDVLKRMLPGFAKVIKDAAQKAKAEAKAASTPATAGQAATAASAKSKAAKRVPKAVQLPPVTPSQGATADPAVDLGRALAQAASSAAANAEAAAEAAQQQSAAQAQSREQRLRARQGLNPGPTEPEQEERPHEQEQEQEEQMPEVQLPNAKDKARGARESTPAVQNGGKRRKLAPGLMESLANGGDSTSADAQGLDMLASAAARGVSSQTSAPPQPTLSQQTLSVQQPDLHPTSTLDSGSVPESIETFHDADSADLRVTRQEFEALWQRAVARGDIRDSQWTQDLKTMALLWAPESL